MQNPNLKASILVLAFVLVGGVFLPREIVHAENGNVSNSSSKGWYWYIGQKISEENTSNSPVKLELSVNEEPSEEPVEDKEGVDFFLESSSVNNIKDGKLIQEKIDFATEDVVYIEPGIYKFTSNLNITKEITLKAIDPDPDKTVFVLGQYYILVRGAGFASRSRFPRARLRNVTIEGITITGHNRRSVNGPIQNYARNLTLRNCKVIDNEGVRVSAIYCWYNSNLSLYNTLIAKNRNVQGSISQYRISPQRRWHGNPTAYTATIYLSGRANLYAKNSTIADNINASPPIIVQYGYGLSEVKIEYSAIHRSLLNYVSISDSIIGNNGNETEQKSFSSMIKFKWFQFHNITYSNIQQKDISGIGRFEYVISEDPQFIAPENGDYNIKDTSPCKGTARDGADMGAKFTSLDVESDSSRGDNSEADSSPTASIFMIDDYNDEEPKSNYLGFYTDIGGGMGGSISWLEEPLYEWVDQDNRVKVLDYDCSRGGYAYYFSKVWDDVTPLDASNFDYISFRIKRERRSVEGRRAKEDYTNCYLKISSGTLAEQGIETSPLNMSAYFEDTDEWQIVDVPISAFTGYLDRSKVKSIAFFFDDKLAVKSGTLKIDNLQFTKYGYGRGKPRANLGSIKGVGYQPTPIGSRPPQPDDPKIYERDFPLIKDAGFDTIRTWGLPWDPPYTHFMEKAREYGLKVIAGFWMDNVDYTLEDVRSNVKEQFRDFVNAYQDLIKDLPPEEQPLLMWALGNENDLGFDKIARDEEHHILLSKSFYSLCNELARIAYEECGSPHPVMVVNGKLDFIGIWARGAEDSQLGYIDVWGINAYYEDFNNIDWYGNVGSFFDFYRTRSSKPFIITEYGADAFRTTSLDPIQGHEDEDAQADWVLANTEQIMAASDVCLGGSIMAYSDEWWKDQSGDLWTHDPGPADDWNDRLPDGRANEEYFGIMRIARDGEDFLEYPWNRAHDGLDEIAPRKVYYSLRELFAGITLQITSISPEKVAIDGTLTITGTNFGYIQGDSQIKFANGAIAPIESWSDTEIICRVPADAESGLLKVVTPDGESNGIMIAIETPAVPQAPIADFIAELTSGIAPLTVYFTDTSTGDITNWLWNFGEPLPRADVSSKQQNPSHTYTTPGTYTVSLTVTGPGGSDKETKEGYITVKTSAPQADFAVRLIEEREPIEGDFIEGVAPLSLQFLDNSEGDIDSYFWYFGENRRSGTTSREKNPIYTYENPGTYKVTLVVRGPGGYDIEAKEDYVRVKYPPPVAAFTATPTQGPAPLTVSFTDESTGDINNWEWSFGDGQSGYGRIVTHTYNYAGTYTASLEVKGPGGEDTAEESIEVTPKAEEELEEIDGDEIQYAIDDAIEIEPGKYYAEIEPGIYELSSNLEITKNIILKAEDPEKTIIKLGEYHILIRDPEHEYSARFPFSTDLTDVTIEGVTITGRRVDKIQTWYGQIGYMDEEDFGPIQNYARGLTLRNCKIIDNEGIRVSAIYTSYYSKLYIENTLIAYNINVPANSIPPYGSRQGYSSYCGTIYLGGYTELYVRDSRIFNNIDDSKPFTIQTGYGRQEIKVIYNAIYRRYYDDVYIDDDSIVRNNGKGSHLPR